MLSPIGQKIYGMLVDAQYSVPQPHRSESHWVMNKDWAQICRLISEEITGFEPPLHVETLLGQAVEVTDAYGDDFPHLVPGAP